MPAKREIAYPVFLEACQYTEDAYWENIFEELAYGKAPYGTYISKDFLCCSYKKKEFSYKLEKKDAKTVFEDVYNLLTNKLGLLSQREKLDKRKAFSEYEDTIKDSRQTWTDIKKKNIKELLIELYVVRMKKKHSLSLKQSRHLLSVITVALCFKVLTGDDICYKDGQIASIEGIDFLNKQVVIKRNLYSLETSFAPNIMLDKKLMADSWDKYLKDLRKLSSEISGG
tara:strand:+ start:819 stop:1499 length:681 start_codon:yes stop_codon:yes gene_type:complete